MQTIILCQMQGQIEHHKKLGKLRKDIERICDVLPKLHLVWGYDSSHLG